ncbi:hypothetical protein N219_00635 [Limosilactobacillus fermentum MTCC 8711]|nr:hypothetical protein N219_00635 [Limosilactobacillus fermentum MTCC 8711]
MNLNGTEDLRVQKTITAIYQAFEELILTTDYEKITVAELARRARINKKTFYRYGGFFAKIGLSTGKGSLP